VARVVIIAGETSGDRLGASLIRAAREISPDTRFEGVTGPLMREAGCETWFDHQELAVMGFFEVVNHLPRLLSRKREVERRLLADPPDVLVGVDSPDFNLRIERVAKKNGIPTVHYVCPTVWAWRPGRVHGLDASADHVLCVFPFEAKFLAEHGVPATFVGHPLADEIAEPEEPMRCRSKLGLTAETVVALLPGSRKSEVTRNGPAFAKTAAWLARRIDGIKFVAPMATPALSELFSRQLRKHARDVDVRLLQGDSQSAIVASDAVIVASGTATLETMLLRRPMVVACKLGPITYLVARQLIKAEYIGMPNLMAGRPIVTELIQSDANAEALGTEVIDLLESSDRRNELAEAFAEQHCRLRLGAGKIAAEVVLGMAGLLDKDAERAD